jgi:pre-mRNA-splicing factor SYF1
MEIRHKNYDAAHAILQRATISPRRIVAVKDDGPVQKRLYKSVKLWSFYADLDECKGTFDTTRAIYDKIIELHVATPQLVLNYATFLEEHKHFEDAFKAYEKGIGLFNFPYVHDIWVVYLTKFVLRYGGDKIERARDLFEQVLEKVPAKESRVFFVMFANLEEEHGLTRHAMSVYDRACRTVAEEDRYALYLLYISRATEFFGVTHTREIYAQAIENLPEKHIKDMCLRFADMERKLGEIDRARAIYAHGAQYCDPRTEKGFWDAWTDFEKKHGNEETFRETLRIRRTIQAQYNTQINMMTAQMLAASKQSEAEEAKRTANEMEAIERRAIALQLKTAPKALPTVRQDVESQLIQEVSAPNTEEIVIREPGEEEEEVAEELEEMQVPAAVFGGVKDMSKREAEAEVGEQGALARIKRQRV